MIPIDRYQDEGAIEFGLLDDEHVFVQVRLGSELRAGLRSLEIDFIRVMPKDDAVVYVFDALNLWWREQGQYWMVKTLTQDQVDNVRSPVDSEVIKAVHISRILVVKNYIESHYL